MGQLGFIMGYEQVSPDCSQRRTTSTLKLHVQCDCSGAAAGCRLRDLLAVPNASLHHAATARGSMHHMHVVLCMRCMPCSL